MRSGQNIPLMKAFGAELKSRRNEMGISQEDLAYRCAVNRTYVAKLELALNQPTLTVMQKIASGLETDLTELIGSTLVRYGKELRIKKK